MGRPAGSRNKTSAYQRKVAEGGITPLEYFLELLRDPKADEAKRFEAAKQAAPYVHPRLSNVEQNVTHTKAVRELSDPELTAIIEGGSSDGAAIEALLTEGSTPLH